MFFRYNIQPTANKAYQLVRKGTMATPAQAVNDFWKELRSKSRVAIEHPGMPDPIRDVAGNAFTLIWTSALNAANENFEAAKQEFEQFEITSKQELAKLQFQLDETSIKNAQLKTDLKYAQNQLQEALNKSKVDAEAFAREKESFLALKIQKEKLDDVLISMHKEFANEVSKVYSSNQQEITSLKEEIVQLKNQNKNASRDKPQSKEKLGTPKKSEQSQNELDL